MKKKRRSRVYCSCGTEWTMLGRGVWVVNRNEKDDRYVSSYWCRKCDEIKERATL